MKSDFGKNIILLNRLEASGFKEWFFYPGMLFRSGEKWWGDRAARNAPHEGLDLCYYITETGEINSVETGFLVPSIYEGTVAGIINDFIGRTLFIRHPQFSTGDQDFFTIYGHITPMAGTAKDKMLGGGNPMATIADALGNQSGLPPHLHISAAFISKDITADELGWDMMKDTKKVRLIDPLPLLYNK